MKLQSASRPICMHTCHSHVLRLLLQYSKGAKEFLMQYRKPMLQSAFDLQSRLTNQVPVQQ